MIEIQASEAKTHFLRLLTRVERGETILISRHGKLIAELSPRKDHAQAAFEETMRRFREFQARMPRFTSAETRSLIDEGRKY